MKQPLNLFRIIGGIALLTLAIGCATNGTQTTDLLTAAGFKLLPADTPKKQELLSTLPKGQLSLITWKGKTFYVQPAAAPNQAYVGTPAEYQTYQQLRLAKQISNENLMAAQMNQDAMDSWGGAWGPGFYGGFYGGRFR
jgi:hypothetical protein